MYSSGPTQWHVLIASGLTLSSSHQQINISEQLILPIVCPMLSPHSRLIDSVTPHLLHIQSQGWLFRAPENLQGAEQVEIYRSTLQKTFGITPAKAYSAFMSRKLAINKEAADSCLYDLVQLANTVYPHLDGIQKD